jgi:hypothetical protein
MNITAAVARLKLPASSGPWVTLNFLFDVHSGEEIKLCKVGTRNGQVNGIYSVNSLPYVNVQARRTLLKEQVMF